jgi:hypothetical protein
MQQQPRPLSDCITDYVGAVSAGDFARGYRGILAALAQFKSAWETAHPKDTVGALYQGYMDMSFVAVLPASLAQRRLKISLVFLHKRGIFSLWLTAGNRAIQKRVSDALKHAPLGKYSLSMLEPGVDAIIALDLPKPYCFDEPDKLTKDLLQAAQTFLADMTELLGSISQENA